MGWSINAKDGMLGQVRGRITHLSLHTADPGSDGLNEVSGGGYNKVAASAGDDDFTAVSSGEFEIAEGKGKAFKGPASGDCGFFGAWDTGTWLGGGSIQTGDTEFNAEGDYILQEGTKFDLNLVCA